ncbi:hypothetical protein M409DRAFT_69997 [Zasmidium cellare ATCC 36951]|uniref:Mediator of RNA polymerase II transcription subunit 21 n=1 Tax=Zasmidium cellare ATCC 36951 TaxID=1080233 RepID=A0A6A6C295_ZASCE|nr:uncharacterized protein M409DRAFT_69997 [Zasmidium cellare ATCC 36951]KAF2161161.1 hypothetical protein M409DRAFT_69997 [Zasmidium cellare ATCC 36951]
MADRLTQLQDFVDDLLSQMYASLNYVYNKHPYGEFPDQPSQAPQASQSEPTANGVAPAANGDGAASQQTPAAGQANAQDDSPTAPDSADKFNAAMHEMAQELVLKEQQIEIVIKSLPGIGVNEADQEKRMRELEVELRQMEEERAKKESEKQAMVDLLGDMISKVKRVP